MNVSLESKEKKYRYLVFLSMFFITEMLVSAIAVKRAIVIGPFIEPGGILIFPLTYFFSDIITEVYGYSMSRHILWCGLACQFLFSIIILIIMKLPAAPFWHNQKSFEDIFGHMLFYCITTTVGTMVGGFVNIYIVSKFKIIMKGKYFWLRSLGSSTIGEFLFSVIALTPLFIQSISIQDAFKIAVDAYLFKVLYGLIAVIPASFIVSFLKQKEQADIYDLDINYNFFKFSID